MSRTSTIQIDGIEPIEAVELREQLGDAQLEVMHAQAPRGARYRSQDVVSAMIQLGPYVVPALGVLAVFLARKSQGGEMSEAFELKETREGLHITMNRKVKGYSKDAPSEALVGKVLERLKNATGSGESEQA